jgi:hypothetical protein
MKFPQVFFSTDLLQQVEGIEEGLRQRRRLGSLGWSLLLIASAAQVTAQVCASPWVSQLFTLPWANRVQP